MTRHYTQDAISEVYRQINALGITTYRGVAQDTATGEYIVLNFIPSARNRAVTNIIVNINFFCPKINQGYINSARNGVVEKAIIEKIESFEDNNTTAVVNYMSLTVDSAANIFNESEIHSMMNIRVLITFS